MDALDLDVFEIGPVRRLIAEAMGQIVELKPHRVVVVLLERHAANFLRHLSLRVSSGPAGFHAAFGPSNSRLLYQDMVQLYRIPVGATSRSAQAAYAAAASSSPLQGLLGRAQPRHDLALVLVEAVRRHRHRDGDDVAERIARDDAGGANAERVLLAIDGDAGLAHGLEIGSRSSNRVMVRGVRCS